MLTRRRKKSKSPIILEVDLLINSSSSSSTSSTYTGPPTRRGDIQKDYNYVNLSHHATNQHSIKKKKRVYYSHGSSHVGIIIMKVIGICILLMIFTYTKWFGRFRIVEDSRDNNYNDNLRSQFSLQEDLLIHTTNSTKHATIHHKITNSERRFKRIVFYNDKEVKSLPRPDQKYQHKQNPIPVIVDPMLHVRLGEETTSQPIPKGRDDNCIPMQQWQRQSYPTCNNIHELDIKLFISGKSNTTKSSHDHPSTNSFERNDRNDNFHLLGKGWFRHTWKVIMGLPIRESVVLKTLRFERDYLSEYFELHRHESIAMEKLTLSPYIIDIYSFCGQSTVNEYADFIDRFEDFKSFAKQLRGKNGERILSLKLQIATMIAIGMQHIHEIDGPDNTTMVHNDINPMNIAITAGGIPKINDFNVVEFMYWDPKTSRRCGFKGRFKEPWWRSPEEMIWIESHNITEEKVPLLDEKVDIYSLGNIIYNLLTGYTPRGATNKERMESVQKQVKKGIPPMLDRFGSKFYTTSDKPAISAMREAINKCYQPDPTKRSSAREITNILFKAMNETQGKN